METKFYLIIMWCGVDAELRGPYVETEQRLVAAKKFMEDEGNENDHTLVRLNITNGIPELYPFTNDEFGV
jgi:hypothetical protein